jgi:Tol biopolymer transport system component
MGVKRSWLCAGAVALGLAAPAHATFPGGNGRIAYTWSRGGEAFESGPSPRLVGVVSVRPDGGGKRLVARRGRTPAYSPGGRQIAFLRGHRLWVAQADGDGAHPVTPKDWLVGDREWSPRGTRLAFGRGFDNSVRTVIYTVEPDGSGLQRLVAAPGGARLLDGAWSPSGEAIVYEQSSSRSLVRIFRAGRATTLVRPAGSPTWSRRGLVAYEALVTGEGRSEVCVRRPDPAAPARCIGFADASVTSPVWSPNGRRLMLMHTTRGEGSAEIWTVRPNGTVLARAPKENYVAPIFSPNGRALSFNLTRFAGDPRLGFTDLFGQRLDGTGRRLIVRGGQAEDPDWQPLP